MKTLTTDELELMESCKTFVKNTSCKSGGDPIRRDASMLFSAIHYHGIRSINDLCEISPCELADVLQGGKSSAKAIQRILVDNGRSLAAKSVLKLRVRITVKPTLYGTWIMACHNSGGAQLSFKTADEALVAAKGVAPAVLRREEKVDFVGLPYASYSVTLDIQATLDPIEIIVTPEQVAAA